MTNRIADFYSYNGYKIKNKTKHNYEYGKSFKEAAGTKVGARINCGKCQRRRHLYHLGADPRGGARQETLTAVATGLLLGNSRDKSDQ